MTLDPNGLGEMGPRQEIVLQVQRHDALEVCHRLRIDLQDMSVIELEVFVAKGSCRTAALKP